MFQPDQDLAQHFREALRYLRRSPSAARVIADLEQSPIAIMVHHADGNGNQFVARAPVTMTHRSFIEWSPYSPGHHIDGWTSPALGLAHELAHAHGWIFDPGFAERMFAYHAQEMDGETPAEEARATAVEQRIARELGEPARRNYRDGHSHGALVFSPTARPEGP